LTDNLIWAILTLKRSIAELHSTQMLQQGLQIFALECELQMSLAVIDLGQLFADGGDALQQEVLL